MEVIILFLMGLTDTLHTQTTTTTKSLIQRGEGNWMRMNLMRGEPTGFVMSS